MNALRPPAFLALLALLAHGCTHEPVPPAGASGQPAVAAPTTPTACDALRGATFRSVKKLPARTGPDGPVLEHQTLTFAADGDQYTWTYADTRSTSSYECLDGAIEAKGVTATADLPFTASFDEKSGRLTWNGVEFERVP